MKKILKKALIAIGIFASATMPNGSIGSQDLNTYENSTLAVKVINEYKQMNQKIANGAFNPRVEGILKAHLLNVANTTSELLSGRSCSQLRSWIPEIRTGRYILHTERKNRGMIDTCLSGGDIVATTTVF